MILSVVIPTMNKAPLLARTLEALSRQLLAAPLAWEIVVVDDGSTDETARLLADWATSTNPPVRVATPPHNVGRAAARNLGARTARGRWLLFLDDDIVAPEGLLQAHLDLLQEDPRRGTIGHAVTDPQVVDAPHFRYIDSRGVARLPAGPAPARYFMTQNAAVPREAFISVGGFDERFEGYGFEDMEVGFRLEEEAGIRFKVLTAPVPIHIHHHTLDEYLDKKVLCGRQSLRLVARLHPERLAEMNLHHVVDGRGHRRRTWLTALTAGLPSRSLRYLLAHWPCADDFRPRLFRALYCPVMNLTIMKSYGQGLVDDA